MTGRACLACPWPCGRACLSVWANAMNFTKDEIDAIQKMLPALGAFVAAQGIGDKAFNDLTRDEVLALCAGTVREFRKSFLQVVSIEQDIPY